MIEATRLAVGAVAGATRAAAATVANATSRATAPGSENRRVNGWLVVVLLMWGLDHAGLVVIHIHDDIFARLGMVGDVAKMLKGLAEVLVSLGAVTVAWRAFRRGRGA